MNRLAATAATLLLCATLAPGAAPAAENGKAHGMAMHGDLKYRAGFRNFDYVNPAAPKGGEVRLGAQGSYDSFNPFIIRGRPPAGIGLIYDTLTANALDEPFSVYCLLCETMEVPQDRSWVAFTLRADARFNDGKPVTVEDVIWTFNTLVEEGEPTYRFYYAGVKSVEKTGDRTVKFIFHPGENRELPLILGQLQVLPKHYWEGRDFAKPTLDPPLGLGPYTIESFEEGRSVTYVRNPDYWGWNHPVRRGFFNYDKVRFDYYRDTTVQVEALKSGAIDYRNENVARNWATAYNVPALRDKRLVKEQIPHQLSVGMQAFIFNLRRPLFQDPLVRRALAYGYDFEYTNKTLFHSQYKRTRSFFDNSELAATGQPRGEEREILSKFAGKLPKEVFTQEYHPPATDGSGHNRRQLRDALKLLQSAGWDIDEETRKLTHKKTGEAMSFEILLATPTMERVALPVKKNLERLGIDVKVRQVDSAQYKERTDDFDFDIIVSGWGQSLSPGNEQRNYWGSRAAGERGSRNFSGVEDPVLDKLIELVISARSRQSLVQRTRALDRVLQWKHIVIPMYHIPYERVVYWNRFSRPQTIPLSGSSFWTWWIDPVKDKMLETQGRSGQN